MNLGKTYGKLRIFPKIFWKSGPWTISLSPRLQRQTEMAGHFTSDTDIPLQWNV